MQFPSHLVSLEILEKDRVGRIDRIIQISQFYIFVSSQRQKPTCNEKFISLNIGSGSQQFILKIFIFLILAEEKSKYICNIYQYVQTFRYTYFICSLQKYFNVQIQQILMILRTCFLHGTVGARIHHLMWSHY